MDRYLESLMVSIRRKQFPDTVHTTLEIVARLVAAPSPFHIPGLGNNVEEEVHAMVEHYLFNADGRMPTQIAELEILHIVATTVNQLPSPAVLRFMFSVNLHLKHVHFCKLLSLAFSLRLHAFLTHATSLLEELRPDHPLRYNVADMLLSDFGPAKKQPGVTAVASATPVTSAPSAPLACLLQVCPRLARLLVLVLMAHRGRLADEVVSMVADWVAVDDAQLPPPVVALTRWCLELHAGGRHDGAVTWKLHLAIMRRAVALPDKLPIALEDVRSWLEAALCGGGGGGSDDAAAGGGSGSVGNSSTSTVTTALDMLAQMLQAVMAAGLLKCDPGKVRQAILPHCPVQNRLLWRVLDAQRTAAGF